MLEDYIRYPIGLQNFKQIRTLDCVYVDKTELVYRLTHTDRVYSSAARAASARACNTPSPTRQTAGRW